MTNIALAQSMFEDIAASFGLRMDINEKAPVELCVTYPAQTGLDFPVTLLLQNNDELHLQTEGLWLSYFPIEEEANRHAFRKDVEDLISGRARIRQTSSHGKIFSTRLQLPSESDWIDSGSNTSGILLPLLARLGVIVTSTRFIQNHAETRGHKLVI